jgi:cell cycle checkpoint protein MEC1
MYCVVPLSERSGLIEFVKDLEVLRNIISESHKNPLNARCLSRLDLLVLTQQRQFKTLRETYKSSPDHPEHNYRAIVAQMPPVLGRWFVQRFPVPSEWCGSLRLCLSASARMTDCGRVGLLLGCGSRGCLL